jgi:hypothetical protein
MSSVIIFFTKILYPTQKFPYSFKYIFKKKLFSFLYPNEVRNSLLFKKKQFIFYKLIFNKKLNSPTNGYYSTRKLKKVFNYHQLKLVLNKSEQLMQTQTLFSTKAGYNTHSRIHGKLKNFTNELSEVSSNDTFNLRGENDSFKLSEVKIPRIQFKPGYQRM